MVAIQAAAAVILAAAVAIRNRAAAIPAEDRAAAERRPFAKRTDESDHPLGERGADSGGPDAPGRLGFRRVEGSGGLHREVLRHHRPWTAHAAPAQQHRGCRQPERRRQQRGNNNNGDNDDNGQRRGRNSGNDALRSQLLDAAQLAPKGKSSIYAQDVQIVGPGGIDGVRFLFPRTNPISANDKEVEFILNVRRIKVDEKFKLSDMQYEGKLAL